MTHPIRSHKAAINSLAIAAVAATAINCSAPTTGHPNLGQVDIALQTSQNGEVYELRDALFLIDGEVSMELHSSNAQDDTALTHELPVGEYTVELQPGWSLVQLGEAGEQALIAELTSLNPVAFSVSNDTTTSVAYRFSAEAAEVDFGSGEVSVSVEVDVRVPSNVYISEVMRNPTVVPDAEGEYIELTNGGSEIFTLQGCRIQRESQSFAIDSALQIPAAGSVVLANGEAPGFTPDYVYSGMSLPNSANFELVVDCSGQEVDRLSINLDDFPDSAGRSLSLDASVNSPSRNDSASAWCLATTPLGADFGTPGAPNPPCSLAQ